MAGVSETERLSGAKASGEHGERDGTALVDEVSRPLPMQASWLQAESVLVPSPKGDAAALKQRLTERTGR